MAMHTLAKPRSDEPATEDLGLQEFFRTVRSTNPFTDNRVNGPAPAELDVPDIHDATFQELVANAQAVQATKTGIGVVLWGEAGIGKSHLLARLGRWAQEEPRAYFVYLHNLQASPENLPRSLLRSVLSQLTLGQVRQLQRTPLFRLALGLLSEALEHDTSVRHSWPKAQAAYERLLSRIGAEDAVRAFAVDRTIYEAIFRFFHSAHQAREGHEDGVARLVLSWLAGDYLDPDDARRIGLSVPRGTTEPVALADAEQVKQVLAALARMAYSWGRPFVLCFDQVDNLDHEQVGALTRFLQALLDGAVNLLVVTTGVKASLLDFRTARLIQDSAWHRVAQIPLDLQRIRPAEARRMVAYRLERFFEPFLELPQVRQAVQGDLLFPLGDAWAAEFLDGKIELRPRDVLSWAREGWRREQGQVQSLGGARWLTHWTGHRDSAGDSDHGSTGPEQVLAAIDCKVEEKVREHVETRRQRPELLPPDADHLVGLLGAILHHWQQGGAEQRIAAVKRRATSQRQRGEPYDLVVTVRHEQGTGTGRCGIVVLCTGNALTTTTALRWVSNDTAPPERILLVTESRQPLAFGQQANAQGRQLFRDLRQRGPERFQHVELALDDYAYLDALQAAAGAARSGELVAELPSAEFRTLSEPEVIASHLRQGRYLASRLLREILTVRPANKDAPV